ncbi:4-(cytidine 5'-diphospho)-2-C-methyl-D-erythritol kinase [Conexibacter sp. SYSU D00693]|uniref:4-(cytidine 5'-diphospho)-2-C-methyl-D-erythritol kinase n=1 Tax=Conexibacter sp. SYSU D00693 TaxID=2812560 RepID=UPI00196AF4BE|nr:4-(cytidine 5'-diphospho)-2-C-methyl-D-erythritol kinase [Conexibacter sp. SYSU D00693]
MRLRTMAPAKVNVCLFLGPLREDGRHELVSVMQSVSLADRVTLEPADGERDAAATPGVAERDDLALKALLALREHAGWTGPPMKVTVDKRIPVAAGMAGGSADAGAALRLAARAAGGIPRDLLHEVAALLGADVPAQVRPGRVLATGIGEVLRRVPGVAPYSVLVVPDPQGLSTADVFREADRLGLPRDADALAHALAAVEAALPDLPDELCVNELEPAALSLRPDLQDRLDAIRAAGADVALVSGSGPTTLGLFRDGAAARAAAARFDGALVAKPVGPDAGEVLAA